MNSESDREDGDVVDAGALGDGVADECARHGSRRVLCARNVTRGLRRGDVPETVRGHNRKDVVVVIAFAIPFFVGIGKSNGF